MIEVFRNQMNANLIYIDATDRFLDKLSGVADPETKRLYSKKDYLQLLKDNLVKSGI